MPTKLISFHAQFLIEPRASMILFPYNEIVLVDGLQTQIRISLEKLSIDVGKF